MKIERGSIFRRRGAWRVALVFGLVALLVGLPVLLTTASRALAGAGPHFGASVALQGDCSFSSDDQQPFPESKDHSASCRLCLGSVCAGHALVPSGAGVSVSRFPRDGAVPPSVFDVIGIGAPSGWGSSWMAQAPPAFG